MAHTNIESMEQVARSSIPTVALVVLLCKTKTTHSFWAGGPDYKRGSGGGVLKSFI